VAINIPPQQPVPQTPPGSRPSSPLRNGASTPEGLEGEDLLDFRHCRDVLLQAQQGHLTDNASNQHEVADAVAWAILGAKITQLCLPDISSPSATDLPPNFLKAYLCCFRILMPAILLLLLHLIWLTLWEEQGMMNI